MSLQQKMDSFEYSGSPGTAYTTASPLPNEYRGIVRQIAHCPGHLGRENTKKIILDDFYWPGFSEEITWLSKLCNECQKSSRRRRRHAPLKSIPLLTLPYHRIAMDIVEPLTRKKQGNRHILVIMDYTTRWSEAFPLKMTDSKK